jgi:hypothetical protein
MDPGSVVREGEMVMVKDTSSLPEWLVGSINSINGGARLQKGTRDAILGEAESRMRAHESVYQPLKTYYGDLATRYNLKPENIVTDVPRGTMAGDPAVPTFSVGAKVTDTSKLPEGTEGLINGVPHVIRNGKPVPVR